MILLRYISNEVIYLCTYLTEVIWRCLESGKKRTNVLHDCINTNQKPTNLMISANCWHLSHSKMVHNLYVSSFLWILGKILSKNKFLKILRFLKEINPIFYSYLHFYVSILFHLKKGGILRNLNFENYVQVMHHFGMR